MRGHRWSKMGPKQQQAGSGEEPEVGTPIRWQVHWPDTTNSRVAPLGFGRIDWMSEMTAELPFSELVAASFSPIPLTVQTILYSLRVLEQGVI